MKTVLGECAGIVTCWNGQETKIEVQLPDSILSTERIEGNWSGCPALIFHHQPVQVLVNVWGQKIGYIHGGVVKDRSSFGRLNIESNVFGNMGQSSRRSDTKLQFRNIAYFSWKSPNFIAPPNIRFRHEVHNSDYCKNHEIAICSPQYWQSRTIARSLE